ncbi:putative NAD-dependent DNA ligase [Cafeteria roenbergensis virus]|uniref:DNA ligase (NAD(+)) n=1 Tax=Cafeteria roenbergensis virus (strain BV-PW1) TaxID=693272 RepID=E3T5N3_CROVB|nr:NAD-dependent DNA ligase [Cafeteria roenbergensis virus BV-PW1]ADO67496.1 putative NAD-dependent DNA ligase [Cafeteria roenbergensis virus BV-PW1]
MIISNLLTKIKEDIFTLGETVKIKELEKLLEQASKSYYNTSNPILTDDQFDILLDFLNKRNPKSTFLKQVGAPIKNKVELDYYLGSMDKIKPPSTKLEKWLKKYSAPYYLSDKLDGISGLVVYQNNKIKLFTRGTATEGMDITTLIKYLNLPSYNVVETKLKKLGLKGHKNLIALRGEIIMSKSNFSKHNKEFKNARNLVAGLVNSKHKKPSLSQDLDFVLYQVVDPVITFVEQMDLIKELGFKNVYYQKEKELNYNVLSQILKQRKNNSDYEVDGIIVTNNKLHKLNIGKNPEFAFAFKELVEETFKESTVKHVEWNISKSGKIMPTVVILPVEMEGVTVSRVTAFNAKYVKENGLGPGSKIQITRSGDVIPYIVKVIKKVSPEFPKIDYKWTDSGVDIRTLDQSDEQQIRQIYFFFKTLDTKRFGLKLIVKMFENNFNTIEKILKMDKDDFIKLDGVKDKSATNFYNELQRIKSTNFPLEKLILATNSLGDNFGSKKAKLIFDNYPDIFNKNIIKNEKIKNEWILKFKNIPGIEQKTAEQIINKWDVLQKNIKWLEKYFTININKSSKQVSNKNLKYIKWVLTGFRDKELQNKIEEMGGTVSNSVSKNTDIVVVKDSSVLNNPTGKVLKAKDLGIKIIEKSKVSKLITL